MTQRRRTAAAPLLCLAFLAAGCHAGPPPAQAPRAPIPSLSPSPAPSPALSHAVRWFRDSAEQRAAYLQAYRLAGERLAALAAQAAPGRWAVVLDADETLLDNSQYQKERELAGLPFTAASWTAWVARKEAPALPGSLAFLERVHALGGKTAVVTNRTLTECPDTAANLRAERLVADIVLCKPDGGESEKDSRFEKLRAGTAAPGVPPLEILLFVGDNIQDFPGVGQDARGDLARLSGFGERFFVLPNPMYGSWERNPAR